MGCTMGINIEGLHNLNLSDVEIKLTAVLSIALSRAVKTS
jgi:hypothetical protein